MQEKFQEIHNKAVCIGCPFSTLVTDSLMCQKFKNGEFRRNVEDVSPEECDTLARVIINTLKVSHMKLGMGFLIQPHEGDLGEATVMLVGPAGIVHQCTVSELFPNDSFAVFPAMSIFNSAGEDVTQTALKAFLQKIYEMAPVAVTAPFTSLLDNDE